MKRDSKKNIIIGVTALLLITLILLGLTYAYYRTRVVGNTADNSVSVSSKKLEVTYADGTSSIELDSKVQPGSSFTKSFTVQNTGEGEAYFSVVLDNLINTFQRDEDWTYTLKKDGSQVSTGTIAVGTHQILVAADSIASGDAEYTLTVTYANPTTIDQSEDMGATLSFRVNISDEVVTWENAEAPSWAEGQITLISAIKANNTASNLTTIPGQEASGANEQGIGSTQDDYGTSYYFRGKVENNYVTYSNMCWRIVRVQGDGSIKLALADGAHPCGTANGYSATDTDSALLTDKDGNYQFAYKANRAADTIDFIFADSDIPQILSTWAENNNLDMSQLVETEWCNDTAITSSGKSAVYDRLFKNDSIASAEPSLKCNAKGKEGTTGPEAKAIRYKNILGILSADEAVFAGAIVTLGEQINDYYLTTNSKGGYWTMSAVSSDGFDIFRVYGRVAFGIEGYGVSELRGIRPSVVLRSDVMIQEGGNGTIDSPYVIK